MQGNPADALAQIPDDFADVEVARFEPRGSFQYLIGGRGAAPVEGLGVLYNRRGLLYGLVIDQTADDLGHYWTARCSLCFAANLSLMVGEEQQFQGD